MIERMLFCLILAIPLTAFTQIGAVPGTLNQIHPDPEQKKFEMEYQDLKDTIKDLDRPGTPRKSKEVRRGTKKTRPEI